MLEIVFKKSDYEGNVINQDSVVNSICEFKYNPDEVITFSSYYRVFWQDCLRWTDERKVQLLLQMEYEKYVNHILPADTTFEETILCFKHPLELFVKKGAKKKRLHNEKIFFKIYKMNKEPWEEKTEKMCQQSIIYD